MKFLAILLAATPAIVFPNFFWLIAIIPLLNFIWTVTLTFRKQNNDEVNALKDRITKLEHTIIENDGIMTAHKQKVIVLETKMNEFEKIQDQLHKLSTDVAVNKNSTDNLSTMLNDIRRENRENTEKIFNLIKSRP